MGQGGTAKFQPWSCTRRSDRRRPDSSLPTVRPQDELLDVLFWWRQVLSLVMGIIWGALPMTGFNGFLL